MMRRSRCGGQGYAFIQNRCNAFRSDLFKTRLMPSEVICMRGAEAAERFYDSSRFTRRRAMPITVLKLLQDFRSVQLLDDHEHRHRNAMLLSLGGSDEAARLPSTTYVGQALV